jgi:hypothetical protein
VLPGVVATVVSVVIAATTVASALTPPAIDVVVASALPPPPQKATIQATYGAVTLDHLNHLHLRVACKSCHGSGPVGPVHLSAEVAHQTCKGCHRTQQRGPVSCTGCHARPVPGSGAARNDAGTPAGKAAAPTPSGEGTRGVPVAGQRAPDAGARSAAVTTVPTSVPSPPAEMEQSYKRVTIEGGFTALQGTEQDAVIGPFLQLRTSAGSAVFTTSVELPGGMRSGRTLGLLGGGKAFPLAPRWNVMALGLLGFDVDNAALALFPMCGVRGGVEWMKVAPTINVFSLSITAARDFGGRRHQAAEMGTVWSLTLSAGNEVTVSRRTGHRGW